MEKIKLLFLAYRSWALEVLPYVKKHPNVDEVILCKTTEEMTKELDKKTYDLILYCGWSEIPIKEVVERIPTFTAHCAADDMYSPGTPLQNQINDGIRFTKHRLVKVGYPELSLREYCDEVDLDISGDIDDIFLQLKTTAITLYNRFLYNYPNVEWEKWPKNLNQKPKRTPKDSEITKDQLLKMNTKELFDFIRSLEDPYPNAYIEDSEGTLYFKDVLFKTNKR